MDLDPPPVPPDAPPSYPHTTSTPRPLRSNRERFERDSSFGLLIAGGVLLLVSVPFVLMLLDYWAIPWRRGLYRRLVDTLILAAPPCFAIACVAKGLWLRWRAQ